MARKLNFQNDEGDQVEVILDADTMRIRNAGQMAEAIYSLVYTGDDKQFHRSKISEITDWLEDGSLDGGETAELLAVEWREYDDQDEETDDLDEIDLDELDALDDDEA